MQSAQKKNVCTSESTLVDKEFENSIEVFVFVATFVQSTLHLHATAFLCNCVVNNSLFV